MRCEGFSGRRIGRAKGTATPIKGRRGYVSLEEKRKAKGERTLSEGGSKVTMGED